MCHGQGCRYIGDKLIPPLIGILIMGPYKPLRTWVDEFIPYYMEIMGVDRPDRTNGWKSPKIPSIFNWLAVAYQVKNGGPGWSFFRSLRRCQSLHERTDAPRWLVGGRCLRMKDNKNSPKFLHRYTKIVIFRKEKHVPKHHFLVSMLNFQGVTRSPHPGSWVVLIVMSLHELYVLLGWSFSRS